MLGDEAEFRDGQEESIDLALSNKKALIVQKTGWGKSIVYFIATKILREQGSGVTILISPLLSLMRNQIENANKLGLVAKTINSSNEEEHEDVFNSLKNNLCDILLISPEQLAKKDRMDKIISSMAKGIGMFVVDEAHCISDWGHDFRPDYRRIINIIKRLPSNVPVIATTATANKRVVDDIKEQLGDIKVLRGELIRESLNIQTIKLKDQAERMAWIVENIPKKNTAGIIYCLTKPVCVKVNEWLIENGYNSRCYHGDIDKEERKEIENLFLDDKINWVVATSALGMGYDKANIEYVVHFQRPGNIVSYYQQIGRAGRKLEDAYVVLLHGQEDDEIVEYFINQGFPTESEIFDVVSILNDSEEGLSLFNIFKQVNMREGRLKKCLKYLQVEKIVEKDPKTRIYTRTINEWSPDDERSKKITNLRYYELDDMHKFVDSTSCYMKFIAEKLDDEHLRECGKCSICRDVNIFPKTCSHENILKAIKFLKRGSLEFQPRKQIPAGVISDKQVNLSSEYLLENAKVLSRYGDAGWGKFVKEDKYVTKIFRNELIEASVELIKEWLPNYNEMNLAYVPSLREPELVKVFAKSVAKSLGIPCLDSIIKNPGTKPQKECENRFFQAENAWNGFSVEDEYPEKDVILIDDIYDSGWTFTACGYKLKEQGAKKVYPFALASTSNQ